MKINAKGYTGWNRAARWWECRCGAILPHGEGVSGALVRCRSCSKVWEFGHWPLSRWTGDKSRTRLQPRLLVPFNAPRGSGA